MVVVYKGLPLSAPFMSQATRPHPKAAIYLSHIIMWQKWSWHIRVSHRATLSSQRQRNLTLKQRSMCLWQRFVAAEVVNKYEVSKFPILDSLFLQPIHLPHTNTNTRSHTSNFESSSQSRCSGDMLRSVMTTDWAALRKISCSASNSPELKSNCELKPPESMR